MGQGERQRVGVGAILADRRVTAVLLVVFIVMAGAGMVLPILPLFARSYGVGYGAVGVLVSAYGLARLVFDLAPAGGSPPPDRGGGGNLARLLRTPGLVPVVVTNFAYLWMVAVVFDTLGPLLAGWAIPLVGFGWACTLAGIPTAVALALVARTPETLRPAEVG